MATSIESFSDNQQYLLCSTAASSVTNNLCPIKTLHFGHVFAYILFYKRQAEEMLSHPELYVEET